MAISGIYKITNNATGHFYIGMAVDVERRFVEHVTPRNLRKNTVLARAIRKHGKENFTFSLYEPCEPKNLADRERAIIKLLKPAYNMTEGGDGCSERNSPEFLKKMSEAGKKAWLMLSPEQRRAKIAHNLCGPRRGHQVSPETRAKLRAANLGRKASPETCRKISEGIKASGFKPGAQVKPVAKLNADGTVAYAYCSVNEAAERHGIGASTITGVLKGRRKTAAGYKWVYVDQLRVVETNGDECSRVGREIWSPLEARGDLLGEAEDIVQPESMEKIGYTDKGFIQLAQRTGQYKKMNAACINAEAFKGFDDVGDPMIDWDQLDETKPAVGYAFAFQLVTGFTKIVYWSRAKVDAHAKRYSQAYRSGYDTPWKTNFDKMALKTVIKDGISHWGIMSVQLRKAVQFDQTVQNDLDSPPQYVDNDENAVKRPGRPRAAEAPPIDVDTVPAGDDSGNGEPEPEDDVPMDDAPPPTADPEPPKQEAKPETKKPEPAKKEAKKPEPKREPPPTSDMTGVPENPPVFLQNKCKDLGVDEAKACAWLAEKRGITPSATFVDMYEYAPKAIADIAKRWGNYESSIRALAA